MIQKLLWSRNLNHYGDSDNLSPVLLKVISEEATSKEVFSFDQLRRKLNQVGSYKLGTGKVEVENTEPATYGSVVIDEIL